MANRFFKKPKERAIAGKIALCACIAIACVLAIAACGKMFYPSEYLKALDRWISAFEILFLFAIVFFRRRWQLWLAASSVFAAWGGYALYWCCVKLPCACMGKMLNIPSGISIAFDMIFFASSLFIAYLLGGRLRWIYLSLITGCLAVLAGYVFAGWVYRQVF